LTSEVHRRYLGSTSIDFGGQSFDFGSTSFDFRGQSFDFGSTSFDFGSQAWKTFAQICDPRGVVWITQNQQSEPKPEIWSSDSSPMEDFKSSGILRASAVENKGQRWRETSAMEFVLCTQCRTKAKTCKGYCGEIVVSIWRHKAIRFLFSSPQNIGTRCRR
jgi:hypothetical protein